MIKRILSSDPGLLIRLRIVLWIRPYPVKLVTTAKEKLELGRRRVFSASKDTAARCRIELDGVREMTIVRNERKLCYEILCNKDFVWSRFVYRPVALFWPCQVPALLLSLTAAYRWVAYKVRGVWCFDRQDAWIMLQNSRPR